MLDEGKLRQALLDFWRTPQGIRSIEDAEERWASAYHSYASDAEDISGDSLNAGNRTGFRGVLNFRSIRHVSQMAQQLDSGFVAYWTGASFGLTSLVAGIGSPCPNVPVPPQPLSSLIFATETASSVIAVAAGAMRAAVLPVLTRNFRGVTAEDQAARLAAAMHSATTTAVTVLITGLDTVPPVPNGGPFPLTNTCTVF